MPFMNNLPSLTYPRSERAIRLNGHTIRRLASGGRPDKGSGQDG